MSASFALYSLDYPPERGGVARYLGDLVEVSAGGFDVFLPETHLTSGPGHVQTLKSFASGPCPWRPMIRSFRSLCDRGYRHLFLSHALPVGTAALLARYLGGIPYSVLVHGLDLRLAVAHRRRRWVIRQVLRHAANVFVNSQAVAQEVRKLDEYLQPVVVTPGVKPRIFGNQQEARRSLNLPADTFLCLTVARLVPRKGIDTMINLLPTLEQNVHYVVIGSGSDQERLQMLADKNGVTKRVTFVSDGSDEARDRWFAAADLFVFLAREEGIDLEGFGIVCLEAAMAGLPVLAGNTGGVKEAVIHEQTGLLVDSSDLASVSAGFQQLFQDASLRQRLGERGRSRVLTEFRWDDRWKQIQQHLSRV